MKVSLQETGRWGSCAAHVAVLADGHAAGGHRGPRRCGTNLKICPGRVGRMECGPHDWPTWRLTPGWRGPFALPPAPSRSHPGSVERALFRGRGGTCAAGPRASHRSDSPTDARSVGSVGAHRVGLTTDASTSQLTLAVRRRAAGPLITRNAFFGPGAAGFGLNTQRCSVESRPYAGRPFGPHRRGGAVNSLRPEAGEEHPLFPVSSRCPTSAQPKINSRIGSPSGRIGSGRPAWSGKASWVSIPRCR